MSEKEFDNARDATINLSLSCWRGREIAAREAFMQGHAPDANFLAREFVGFGEPDRISGDSPLEIIPRTIRAGCWLARSGFGLRHQSSYPPIPPAAPTGTSR